MLGVISDIEFGGGRRLALLRMTPESPARAPLTPAGLLVLGAVGFLVSQIAALACATVAVRLFGHHRSVLQISQLAYTPAWFSLAKMLGIWLGFGVAGVVAWQRRPRRDSVAALNWRDGRWLVLGVVAQLLVNLAYRPFHLRNLNAPTQSLFGHTSLVAFIVLALAVTVVAPVLEELLFRGVLVSALEGLFGRLTGWRLVAIVAVVDGVLFGLAHGELAQLPGLASLGALLAIIFLSTRRLVPCVLTHAGFNVLALVVAAYGRAKGTL